MKNSKSKIIFEKEMVKIESLGMLLKKFDLSVDRQF